MFNSPPHRLELADYQNLVNRSIVVERDRFGEKVLRTPEGLMVKIFRRKRLLTTAVVVPYATRFVRNAHVLAQRGIATVTVVDYAHCPALCKHLVTYRPLPGLTLRQSLMASVAERLPLIADFARFIATLHQKGVYFRSLHFGNVVVHPDSRELGLIDVADTGFRSGSLSTGQRVRNFRHMLRYREDRAALHAYGWDRFVDDYCAAAVLPPRVRQKLLDRLHGCAEFSAADG